MCAFCLYQKCICLNGQEVSPEEISTQRIFVADNRIAVLEPTVIDGKQWNGYGIWITGEVSLGSTGETIPSEDDDPENTANPTTNGIPAGRYIIRGVTARNNTISGNCDGIKFFPCRRLFMQGEHSQTF